jgi:hypothetical protein
MSTMGLFFSVHYNSWFFKNRLPSCLSLFTLGITGVIHSTCPAHLILHDFITLKVLGAQYKVILANPSKRIYLFIQSLRFQFTSKSLGVWYWVMWSQSDVYVSFPLLLDDTASRELATAIGNSTKIQIRWLPNKIPDREKHTNLLAATVCGKYLLFVYVFIRGHAVA